MIHVNKQLTIEQPPGKPLDLIAWSAAAISASTVLCDTAVCFLLCPESGQKLWSPCKAKNTPEVDLMSALSPAKSASENSPNYNLSGESPMNPICRHSTVPLMCLIIRNRFRSKASSQLVIIVVIAPIACKRSCLASLAMYMFFIRHFVAIWDSSPVTPAFAGGNFAPLRRL